MRVSKVLTRQIAEMNKQKAQRVVSKAANKSNVAGQNPANMRTRMSYLDNNFIEKLLAILG